jgi:flagellar motor switch protein FliN/FliY
LKTGETVELDASLGRAVELRLNGKPIARGELVAAGDKFAVRLTEISK